MPSKRQKLVTKLDRIFSQFIRLRKTDSNGYGSCYTCGAERFWREVDAGHFMSRACMSTRWDETNVQFQCKRCNGFRSGEQYLFARALDQEYGEGTADTMLYNSKYTRKFAQAELQEMIEYYTEKVNDLKGQKGV